MLDDLIQQGGASGVQEIVIGMAHRGRINVLVNVLGKAPQALFREFEGRHNIAGHDRLGRREVPHGIFVGHPHAGRQCARGAGV